MNKCEFALANGILTGVTAYIEYNTAPTKNEGIKKVVNRIKENKTIESITDCILDSDSNCKC